MSTEKIEFSLVNKGVDTLSPSKAKWDKSGFPYENAGLDFYALNPVVGFVHKSQVSLTKSGLTVQHPIAINAFTNIKVNLPPGIHMLVAGRSGLSFNSFAHPFYGVIDSSYHGEIVVRLYLNNNLFVPKQELTNNDIEPITNRWAEEESTLYMLDSDIIDLPFDLYLFTYTDTLPDINTSRYYLNVANDVKLQKNADKKFDVTKSAIAQGIFLNYAGINLGEVTIDVVEDFKESTSRGERGFGSTG